MSIEKYSLGNFIYQYLKSYCLGERKYIEVMTIYHLIYGYLAQQIINNYSIEWKLQNLTIKPPYIGIKGGKFNICNSIIDYIEFSVTENIVVFGRDKENLNNKELLRYFSLISDKVSIDKNSFLFILTTDNLLYYLFNITYEQLKIRLQKIIFQYI